MYLSLTKAAQGFSNAISSNLSVAVSDVLVILNKLHRTAYIIIPVVTIIIMIILALPEMEVYKTVMVIASIEISQYIPGCHNQDRLLIVYQQNHLRSLYDTTYYHPPNILHTVYQVQY